MRNLVSFLVCYSLVTICAIAQSGPPAILQDLTNIMVVQGQPASFSITATGTPPLTYSWQFNGVNIAGANSSTYTISNAQPINLGSYDVVVANALGTATSSIVSLGFLSSYTLNLGAGYSLIANQLDHGSNTFDVVFAGSGAQDFDSIQKYNCDGTFTIWYFDSSSPTGFDDGNGIPASPGTLAPGEGAFFVNNHGATESVTFTGVPHVPVLPASLPCGFGNQNLLSHQTNDAGTYENITGYSAVDGAQVLIWNGSGYNTNIYSAATGAWSGGTPSLSVGQSAFFVVPTASNPGAGLVYQGLTNTGTGSATLAITCCVSNLGSSGQDGLALVVSNLGSSGQDGVSISLPTNMNHLEVDYLPLDPSDSLPVGAYIQSQAVGAMDGFTSGVLATETVTKAGSGNYSISADYSALGVSNYTVQVYYQGALVAQNSNQPGPVLATASVLPRGKDLGDIITPLSDEWLASQNAYVSIGTGAGYPCDHLVIIPEDLDFEVTPATFQITASQIPSITISGEILSLVYQGLTNTSLGAASLGTYCCVSNLGSSGQDGVSLVVGNLGSSGQDGVSISLSSDLSSLDVDWQPLDYSNTAPVGAYLLEKIVGPWNGVSNYLMGTVSMAKQCAVCGGSNFIVSADFSPVGASTYTVQAYLNGALVAQATGQPGSALAYCGIWDDSGCIPPPPVFGGGLDWTNTTLTLGNGTSAQCDHLYIIPENITAVGPPSAVQFTASGLSSITITGIQAAYNCTNRGITVHCPTNKIVPCGSAWAFDQPVASTCCSNRIQTSTGTVTNLLVTSTGIVTNSLCPLSVTEFWTISDGCGDTNYCSQTVTATGCVPPPSGLVLWLPFDESSGTIATNLYVGGNQGTLVNGPSHTIGSYVDNSLLFNGNNQYVSVSNYSVINPAFGQAFTIDAWIRRAVGGPNSLPCVVLDKRDPNSGTGYSVSVDYGHVFLTMSGNNYADISTVIPPDGTWHFIAVTVSGGSNTLNGEFYIDGLPPVPFSPTAVPLANTAPLLVGVGEYPGNRPWQGSIDEVEIFNRALASNEISSIYLAGTAGKCKLPAITCTTNKTVQCGSKWSFDPPIVNGCGTLSIISTVTNGSCPQTATRQWMFAGGCGGSNFCSQTVTIVDNNPPILTAPANFTVPCGTAWTFGTPTVSDPCGTNNIVVVAKTPVTNGTCPRIITETWVASNVCNRLTATASQTVTVVSCVPAPSGLVLWLPFDESSGTTTANLYAGGNSGALVNGPTHNLGTYVDNSLCFSGNNQYVSVSDYTAIDPVAGASFTLDAWIERAVGAPNSPTCVVLDKRDPGTGIGYSISVDFGHVILTMSANNYADVTDVIPADGTWHFIAITVSAGGSGGAGVGKIYVDGHPPTSFTPASGSLASTAPFLVGEGEYPGNEPWQGCIDEVEMFNRALSSNEVYTIYHAGQAGKCKSPELICSTNKTVQCGSAWIFDPPVLTACGTNGGSLIVLSTSTNGVCPKIATRQWLYVDACGNSNYCSQTVTLVDTTLPVILCTNVFVPLNTNCNLVIPLIKPIATDNCTPASQLVYHQSPAAGTILPGPNQIVTVWVTDLCGNSNQCKVVVEGEDQSVPIVSGPTNVLVTNCVIPCVTGLVSAYDKCCPRLTITQSPLCGTPIAPGITYVTVTVTDNCDNKSATWKIYLTEQISFLTNLFNTGVNSSHVVLADNTVDAHYALPYASVPPTLPGAVGDYHSNSVAVSDICHSIGSTCAYPRSSNCFIYTPWGLISTASKWIAPDYTNNGCCVAGNYTYTLNFTLPAGICTNTASISGRWAADNSAQMYLNGTPIPAVNGGTCSSWTPWTPFTIPAGSSFLNGANSLAFVVNNSSIFTGLRVEFTNAFACCAPCAPPCSPVIISAPQRLPEFSTATINVIPCGTGPLSYQWYHNGVKLTNNGHDYGVTTPSLQIKPLLFPDAGSYTVVVSNACGVATGQTSLSVTYPWIWPWAWWNVAQPAYPMAASAGPDLNLTGSVYGTNYSITSGTSEDFGLPPQDGQVVNVMDIAPMPVDTAIQLPLIAPAGSNSVPSYSVIMDIYEPDTSLGTPSTLFQSISCCISNLSSSGQDGVGLTLDGLNNLHLTGYVQGAVYDIASSTPMPVDAWNRVACVVDDPQDGVAIQMTLYINGQASGSLTVPTATGLPINWSNSIPTLLSRQTNDTSVNGEFIVSSIQFHGGALTPEQIAGIGSPDNGPAPANDTSVGNEPVLTATAAGRTVSLSWSGSSYVLQEASDVTSDGWTDSALSFTETTDSTGVLSTTATVTPGTGASSKFYRLIFRP